MDRFDRYVPAAQLFAARLVLFQDAVARRLDMTATELKCLRLVEAGSAQTAADLVGETGLTAASMSVIVERLERRGFLSRERDAIDRRKWRLRVVSTGIAKIDGLYADHAAAACGILSDYSDDQFELVLSFLETFSGALRSSALRIAAG